MCLASTNGKVSHAVLVPKCLHEHVLRLARDSSGHYGVITTCSLINFNFTWPSLYADNQSYIKNVLIKMIVRGKLLCVNLTS